jgi:transcriptional regulator with XRE-family HTH domain
MFTKLEPFQYTDILDDQCEQVKLLISEADRNHLHLQDKNICTVLKKAREKHGLTVTRLAKDCGVTSSYISKVENGSRIPSATVFSYICSRLGMSRNEGESLNRLRILNLREYKDKDINDIIDLCNDLLMLPKTVATKVAIASLIKSCMERYVNNYPKQDVYSARARDSRNSSEDNVSLELIKSKHVLTFIQVYKGSFDEAFSATEGMLYMVNIFCKRVIVTSSEFNSLSSNHETYEFFSPKDKDGEYRDRHDPDAHFLPLVITFEDRLKELNIDLDLDDTYVFDTSISVVGFQLFCTKKN